MNIIKFILNSLLYIIIIIGCVVSISLLPIKGNFKIMSVMSGSMEPSISTGELIITKPAKSYKVGDIVTFKNQDNEKSTTTHRIIEEMVEGSNKLYRTKGDANKSADNFLVSDSQIVGKYRFGIKYLGYLIGYIKTLPGLLLIIIIPATIIIYEESRKIHREGREILKKRREKKFTNLQANSLKPKNYKLNKERGGKSVKKNKKDN